MTVTDIPEAMRLTAREGWNQTPADWQRLIAVSPEGCFAADHRGRLLGTVTTIVYAGRIAWVGMLVVERAQRGRGLGTRLLELALEYLVACGVPCLKLDATPLGRPLYQKLGFVPEYDIERWVLSRSRECLQAWPRSTGIEDILPLDREVFGADRGDLLRWLSETAPEFSVVVRQDGVVAGYALGRHGARADHLGPWVAREEQVAASLLEGFLRRSPRERIFVDCVASNSWAAAIVQTRGFAFSRLLTRMFRGVNASSTHPELVGAIVGPEFG